MSNSYFLLKKICQAPKILFHILKIKNKKMMGDFESDKLTYFLIIKKSKSYEKGVNFNLLCILSQLLEICKQRT